MPEMLKSESLSFLAETAPVYSLTDTLALRPVTNLKKLASGLRISNAYKLRKAELIYAVSDALQLPARLEELLYIIDEHSWTFFQSLASEQFIRFEKPRHQDREFLLESLGYIQPFLSDGVYIYVLPDEVKATYQMLVAEGFLARKQQSDLAHAYATAAVHLYGIIRQDEFLDLFHAWNKSTVPSDEILGALLRHIAVEDGYCFWNNYLVDDRFIENGFSDVEDLLKQVENKPRYIPKPKEFLRYADWRYYAPTPYTQNLFHFLTHSCGQNPTSANDAISEIVNTKMMNGNIQLVLGILEDYGVDLSDDVKFDHFIKLITEVTNHTRMWANNGHTPNEIAAMYRSTSRIARPISPCKPKIGRNDPCPCGSGLKYKRCCGR